MIAEPLQEKKRIVPKKSLGFPQNVQKKRSVFPKSDDWFFELWKTEKIESDQYEEAFLGLNPILINHNYLYVVLVDGKTRSQAIRDVRKYRRFLNAGYEVFHITAHNKASYLKARYCINKRRADPIFKPLDRPKPGPKTILRKGNLTDGKRKV